MMRPEENGHHSGLSRRRFLSGAFGTGLSVVALSGNVWATVLPKGDSGANLVPNPGFEELSDGQPIHWRPFNQDSRTLVRSSQERTRGAARSVRLDDPGDSVGVGLRSSFIPVRAGVPYAASAHTFVEEGRASLYLEFWDSTGKRISFEFRVSSQLHSWQRVDVGAVAPENAVHATVLLYLPAANTGIAFFDDIALVEQAPLLPATFGPASLTAAVRGGAVLGDSVFISSRFNTPEQKLRLGEFDVHTGMTRSIDDLAIPSSGGQKLATDGRYVYIGPAGSAFVWRFDPGTKELLAWAEAGSSTTWYYDMVVEGGHLYIGTYPDCTVKRVQLSDATVETYGRISSSKYATAVDVDDAHVYAGSAAPGTLLVWPKAGGTPTDLTAHLSDSPVGILDLTVKDGMIYVASGRQVISLRRDGSGRVSREIPAEDRYIDQVTVGSDGKVYALARLTTNLYVVTATGLSKVGRPLDHVENQLLAPLPDGSLVGVSGLGHVWKMAPDSVAAVWQTAERGFGYPEIVQSMLLHSRNEVWVAGHYAMTVHDPSRGSRTRLDINGEPKSLAEGASGVVYAGLYPSTQIVAIDAHNHELSILGSLENEQLRVRQMYADVERDLLLVASGPKTTKHAGALTFIDVTTNEFDVHREYLPDQSVMDIAVSGRTAYIVGDTYGEAAGSPLRPTAQVAAVDIVTREILWREEIKADWASYESVHVVGNLLYAMGRRPRGAWYAYDLQTRAVVMEGDLGGYGQFGGPSGRVFSWVHWANDICELPKKPGRATSTLHYDVPRGWYNDPMFNITRDRRATWGMHGTDLALFPLPRRS